MGKRKRKKRHQRPIVIQQQAPKEKEPRWKAVATRSLAALSVLGLVLALLPLYPTLSINEDYSFDKVFPYNTSFSVTNEGFWPIADISVTCGADFTMRPWTNDPANKSSMKLHTQDSEYKDVAKLLTYKHRLTLPCNHNAVANGHQIDPGASLHILVKYRLAGTDFKQSKDFELKTVAGWGGQSFWQYK